MRRTLRQSGIMSDAIPSVIVGGISMEEQEILISEASQDLAEAEETAKDTVRLEDVAGALEDMAELVDENIVEARPIDLVMVETASRLAVAGSDVSSDEITPSLENYLGKQISMEGPRDLARQIWEAIKAAVKRIYAKIESFFYKIIGTIPNMRRSVEAVRNRMKKTSTVKEVKTKLSSEVNSLVVAGVVPKSGHDIVASMKNLAAQADLFMKARTKDIIKMGDAITDGLNDFDPEHAKAGLEGIISKVGAVKPGQGKESPKEVHGDARFAEKEYFAYPALPGGYTVYLRDGNKSTDLQSPDEDKILGQAEAQRRTGYAVHASLSKTKEAVKEAEISTLSTGDISSILDEILSICDSVESYERSAEWKKVKDLRAGVNTAAEKMTAAMQKNTELTSVQLSYYRSAAKYATSFSSYSTQPMASLTAQALKSCRAAIVACNKSLSNYN